MVAVGWGRFSGALASRRNGIVAPIGIGMMIVDDNHWRIKEKGTSSIGGLVAAAAESVHRVGQVEGVLAIVAGAGVELGRRVRQAWLALALALILVLAGGGAGGGGGDAVYRRWRRRRRSTL